MLNKKNKLKKIYLLVLAFTSGLTIMAVEISAARLIAPYFGTSTFVWTNIIGVIMIALAIGYYFGGKLADQQPNLKLLLKIIIIACLFLLIIPFITKPLVWLISQFILISLSASLFIFLGSFIAVSLLFIVPIILLGMVSPFIIKLLSEIDPQIGKDAGLVFSVSTIGSIIGTFLPILVFIPWLGTRKTIFIFSLFLLFIVLIGFLKRKRYLIFLIFILPVLFINLPDLRNAQGQIYETESAYQYIQVVEEEGERLLKINEGYGIFSVLNLSDEVLTGYYYDYYNLLPYLSGNNQVQDILILGLATGTISTQLDHYFAEDYNLQIDGVEIDQKIIDIGEVYFEMLNPSLNVYNMDGRNFLELTDKLYDSIIIDVYANHMYISFHLTTKEFFGAAKKHLKASGVVAINVNAVSKDSALLKNITNTMLLVFANVYMMPQSGGDWNYMVIASDNVLDFKKLNDYNINQELNDITNNMLNKIEKVNYDYNYSYLTDDRAPIEHLTDWMILDYILNNI